MSKVAFMPPIDCVFFPYNYTECGLFALKTGAGHT